MRVLIHSNGPHVPSGYGKQARLLGLSLRELGHEVAFSCFSGLTGQPIKWEDFTLFPHGPTAFGVDVLVPHALTFGADVVITLMDTYMLAPAVPQIKQLIGMGVQFVPFLVFDSEPMSHMDRQVLQALDVQPVAVSKWGQKTLTEQGFDAGYVPHCFDEEVYYPADREVIRKELGVTDDMYLIGMCAANNDTVRKAYAEQFRAFSTFTKTHPQSRLVVMSVIDNPRGLHLDELAYDMGIVNNSMFTPTYEQVAGLIGEDYMARWYSALDLLSGASYAEGFGVPLIEAQAVGTPIVATRGSAMTELAKPAGYLVDGSEFWNPSHRAWWTRPDTPKIVKAYEKAFNQRGSVQRERAATFALEYTRANVRDKYLKPLMDRLASVRNVVTYDGLDWHVGDKSRFGDVLAFGHEKELDAEVLKDIGDESVFVDIGAHVGHYALRAAKAGARVIAIEADPDTAGRLRENAVLNDLLVDVRNVAAWDEETTLTLVRQAGDGHGENDGTNYVRTDVPEFEREEAETFSVPASTMDFQLEGVHHVDTIKIDVEGADLHVLRGLKETLRVHGPRLVIEDHSVYGMYDRADLNALLEDNGYTWRDVKPCHVIAEKSH